MDIELTKIKICDLVDGYVNSDENGVVGYHGQLDIRPKYQREFIYKDDQQKAVIDTIKKGYPLNIMYWVETAKDKYELLDGQQRTMSICQFYKGIVWYIWDNDLVTFNNLKQDQKDKFLDYELTVYICKNGTDSERLEWFRTINIAGEKLEEQEIRNAVYAGEWVTDLKKKFAKSNGVGVLMGSDYLNGEPIRQKYVETVLKWISAKDVTDPNLRKDTDKRIKAYMALHQHDTNADYEWQYFQNVINWVKTLFPTYRKKLMKGLDWGTWYNLYGQTTSNNPDFTATKLEERIQELINDDEITNQKGIYEYLLTGNENVLSLREFDDKIKMAVYEKQKGICVKCKEHFEYSQMQGDHIIPWSKHGKTVLENCQMLCQHCNGIKSNK